MNARPLDIDGRIRAPLARQTVNDNLPVPDASNIAPIDVMPDGLLWGKDVYMGDCESEKNGGENEQ